MTLDEFKTQTKSILNKMIGDDQYINALDKDMERAYKEADQLKHILGYSNPDPNGYALGISLLYPDLP